MGARQKLNAAHLSGALVVADVIGLATESWLVFPVALTGLILAGVVSGDIRR